MPFSFSLPCCVVGMFKAWARLRFCVFVGVCVCARTCLCVFAIVRVRFCVCAHACASVRVYYVRVALR